MASPVTLWVADAAPRRTGAVAHAARRAFAVLGEVERQCTRFDEGSALMGLNRRPGEWVELPAFCYRALAAASRAWRLTDGRFDPRVLAALTRIGYGGGLPFDAGPVHCAAASGPPRPVGPGPFILRRPRRRQTYLLDGPLDLGGIAKGLGVRWASRQLSRVSGNFLMNAGGDCFCRGEGPEGEGWRVGVEDPRASDYVAVLVARDRAICTSSLKRRSWRAGAERVHHLIDPRAGAPAQSGLLAVTVVAADPAWAEVWAKVLFIEGLAGIAPLARARKLAALWVGADGVLGWSAALEPYLLWTAREALKR